MTAANGVHGLAMGDLEDKKEEVAGVARVLDEQLEVALLASEERARALEVSLRHHRMVLRQIIDSAAGVDVDTRAKLNADLTGVAHPGSAEEERQLSMVAQILCTSGESKPSTRDAACEAALASRSHGDHFMPPRAHDPAQLPPQQLWPGAGVHAYLNEGAGVRVRARGGRMRDVLSRVPAPPFPLRVRRLLSERWQRSHTILGHCIARLDTPSEVAQVLGLS